MCQICRIDTTFMWRKKHVLCFLGFQVAMASWQRNWEKISFSSGFPHQIGRHEPNCGRLVNCGRLRCSSQRIWCATVTITGAVGSLSDLEFKVRLFNKASNLLRRVNLINAINRVVKYLTKMLSGQRAINPLPPSGWLNMFSVLNCVFTHASLHTSNTPIWYPLHVNLTHVICTKLLGSELAKAGPTQWWCGFPASWFSRCFCSLQCANSHFFCPLLWLKHCFFCCRVLVIQRFKMYGMNIENRWNNAPGTWSCFVQVF